MTRISFALLILFVSVSCGDHYPVHIDSIRASDGAHTILKEDGSVVRFYSNDVDTVQQICVQMEGSGDDLTVECVLEPYTTHSAEVTVSNTNPPVGDVTVTDPDSPVIPQDTDQDVTAGGNIVGQEVIKSYSLTFRAIGNSPELSGHSGPLTVVLNPGTQVVFTVLLVDISQKAAFRNAEPNAYGLYNATYKFKTKSGMELEGGTTIQLGSFENCPADHMPVELDDMPAQCEL